ncbi:MAG: hypothetical protein H6863_06540 [Rhodospirillales bacterium]|nr:hypothetical protein [Rhodospirillales bacterium]
MPFLLAAGAWAGIASAAVTVVGFFRPRPASTVTGISGFQVGLLAMLGIGLLMAMGMIKDILK